MTDLVKPEDMADLWIDLLRDKRRKIDNTIEMLREIQDELKKGDKK